jgi:hypothetical protein
MSLINETVAPPSHEGDEPSDPEIAKVTVPVGTPIAGLATATVAVKLTGWPVTVGVDEETTVVVVGPRWIVLDSVPVLGLNVPSPE